MGGSSHFTKSGRLGKERGKEEGVFASGFTVAVLF